MFNLHANLKNRDRERERSDHKSTGHDRFCQTRLTNRTSSRKTKKSQNLRRTNSANEFDFTTLTAANKRQIFSRHRSASSEQDNISEHQSEHSEKSPLVNTRIENLAKIFFSKSLPSDTGNSTVVSILERPNLKYQYTALDSGSGIRSERDAPHFQIELERENAFKTGQQWTLLSNGRYEIICHLNEIGSREQKNWFLVSDSTIRTNRLMTLLPLPQNCVALEELPSYESPKEILMELLGSLHHPYIYPVLDIDLGFLNLNSKSYACLVMPFNPRGSLKDLIYKSNWNEPWNHKYSRKPSGLPINQVQILGRQILEALLFLKERGFPLHGHLHSGNVILQNGVARLSGLENGLLGLSSKVNAIVWSQIGKDADSVENVDIKCFGHLLYEMSVGYELDSPKPSMDTLEEDLRKYPQVFEILHLIFNSEYCPTLEDLVLCDWFRSIDLRELRGSCVSTMKPSLSKSTLNLLEAVKKRQTISIHNLLSETSSPCTPPSSPRIRSTHSFENSSDSDGILDEIIVTSSYESHHYDPLQSPIHFCDSSLQSDDNYAIASGTEITGDQQQIDSNIVITCLTNGAANNQLTTEMCKNSKSRRLEYSLKYLKYGKSNPSQDSAFGSLSESVASSSFVRSFQSMSSPIDEGVEDILISTISANNEICVELRTPTHDSAVSTPSRDYSSNLVNSDSTNRSLSISPKRTRNSVSTSNLQFDPPKILVNDQQNSSFNTSPSKNSGSELFLNQKYRISSFEDISPCRKHLKSVNKIAFRSLEEEKRIDNAFIPIKDRTISDNRMNIAGNEKYNKLQKLTHSTFCGSDTRRNAIWKENVLYHKAKINKSNESLSEQQLAITKIKCNEPSTSTASLSNNLQDNHENEQILVSNNQELSITNNKKLQKSDKYLFNLSKFKQTAINDCISDDESYYSNNDNNKKNNLKKLKNSEPSTSSLYQLNVLEKNNTIYSDKIKYQFNSNNKNNIDDCDSDEISSDENDVHQDVCKIIGGIISENSEEKTPLLDNVEMSPISPNESPDLVM